MSELEKKAKQLTDEELEQVTGGGNQYTDKDPEKKGIMELGTGVNEEGSQEINGFGRIGRLFGPVVKDEGSQGFRHM